MKCLRIAVVLLGLAGGFLRAEVFNTATVLKPGHVSLNFEEQYNTGPEDFEFLFHLGVGIVDNLSDLCLTVGVPSGGGEKYFGVDVEFVLSRSSPAASVAFGVHQQEDTGIDTTLLMSGRWGSARPYCGLDFDYDFAESGDFHSLNLVIGMETRFRPNAGFILEAGFELDTNYESGSDYISLGLSVYF